MTRAVHREAVEALAATGPHPDHAGKLMLFGQFVGSWDVEATLILPDGARRELRGEWHFGWILEGRAIQDVLISPPRAQRSAGEASVECGTTVRFYDPRTDRWHVTYITPVAAEVHHLSGGQTHDGIVLEGVTPDGRRERWSFLEITKRAFRWRGQVSRDDGQTWFATEEMRVCRRSAG